MDFWLSLLEGGERVKEERKRIGRSKQVEYDILVIAIDAHYIHGCIKYCSDCESGKRVDTSDMIRYSVPIHT